MSVTAYLAMFGAGVASFLAPCVLPLVPAYVGMLAGAAARSSGAVARASGLFVVGFGTVFVSLGALAGQLGSRLDDAQVWLVRIGGVLVIAFGLLLLGVLRGRLLRERRFVMAVERCGDAARPLVMGVTFGAAWTPCVGPLLGSALVLAAGSSGAWQGALLLCAYAAGLGVPFVAAALALTSSPSLISGLRRFSSRIEPFVGLALIAIGVLLLSGLYEQVIDPFARLAPRS